MALVWRGIVAAFQAGNTPVPVILVDAGVAMHVVCMEEGIRCTRLQPANDAGRFDALHVADIALLQLLANTVRNTEATTATLLDPL